MVDCDLLLSSSLYGIVLADALRVPSAWLTSWRPPRANASDLPSLPPPHPTASLLANLPSPLFKFVDYYASIRRPPRTLSSMHAAVAILRRDTARRGALKGTSSSAARGDGLGGGAGGAGGAAEAVIPDKEVLRDEAFLQPTLKLDELVDLTGAFLRAFPWRDVADCPHRCGE